MNTADIIEAANQLTVQRFLARYFSACPRYATFEVAGATISVEPSRHRTGIPLNAECTRYVITHPEQGWSIVARSVWRDGCLHAPAATHTRIDIYTDLARHGGEEAVAAAVNRWLVDLDL